MKKVIIIGASSGIGQALATVFSEKGYEVGLIARRLELLHDLQKELKTKSYIKQVDITNTLAAITEVQSLIQEMRGVDIFIINSGVCYNNPEINWDKDEKTIEVNVLGFSAMAHVALTYFLKKNDGHLVGISSVSALRGESFTPAYSASKAFVSNYLQGIRYRMAQEKKAIYITDIRPGWVDTDMAKGEKTFWMTSPKEAALEIFSAINQKRSHAYITSKWRFYAWLAKFAPEWLYNAVLK
jgi:short-subunit dehydrogenase